MSLIVIAHNIRSTHNVGSIFRTCEGFGTDELILSGYTPYPRVENDARLPHISEKLTAQIEKTALGATALVPFRISQDVVSTIADLKQDGYRIVGLEQDERSINLSEYTPPNKTCLILGEEVKGISAELLPLCDDILEIPMKGKKESFNVSVAAGIALYQLTL
jgi:tRNA G18 (ribose-2'-O)-methylase SpoU